jgi:acyl carrier protein phosphodiesterase
MNFLAHTYLSGNNEELMVGNFIADHVKGNGLDHFKPEIVEGIILHRKIDEFTDRHPQFIKSSKRLSKKYHKYSGVITDMFYDHFLASNWNDYSHEDLVDFTLKTYKILFRNWKNLPPKTKRILPFMMSSNWLASYAKLSFLQRSLEGMASRTTFYSGMQHSVKDLKKDYHLYLLEFKIFFPELIDFVQLIKTSSSQ